MNAARVLLECALRAYPADFRDIYREQIFSDFDEEREHETRANPRLIADVVLNGLAMRWDSTIRDIRKGLYRLGKTPLFTLIVIAIFAVGVAVNVAVFAVLHAVVLSPLPYGDANRLVMLSSANPAAGIRRTAYLSVADGADIRRRASTFDGLAAYVTTQATLTGAGKPVALPTALATWRLFNVLQERPEIGRFFGAADSRHGVHSIVISDAIWRARFNADPQILGRRLTLDGARWTVVGVAANALLPDRGSGLAPIDVWEPVLNENDDGSAAHGSPRGARFVTVIARTKAVASAQVDADMMRVTQQLDREFLADRGWVFGVTSLKMAVLGDTRWYLWSVFTAVAVLLLVTCANVTGLILARVSDREREIALRTALGASRGRVGRELFLESALPVVAGAVLGIMGAYDILPSLSHAVFQGTPRIAEVSIDPLTLTYAIGITLVVVMLAGMWPALTAARRGESSVRIVGRGVTSSHSRARSTLVVVEIACAFALVVGAGLLSRTVWSLAHQDLGIRPTGVSATSIFSVSNQYSASEEHALFKRLNASLRAQPGIDEASIATSYPLSHVTINFGVAVAGKHYAPTALPTAQLDFIGRSYFSVLGIPLLLGRVFTDADDVGSQPVAIVNQSFVHEFLAGENPIGKRLVVRGYIWPNSTERTIVGVVADERDGLSAAAKPEYFVPILQQELAPFFTVLVRGHLDVATTTREVDDAFVRALPLAEPPVVRTMSSLVDTETASNRTIALLFGILAMIAFVLSIVGIYGIVSYSVTKRTAEFGVRRALGAEAMDIVRIVIVRAFTLCALGIGIGIVLAGAIGNALKQQLFSVSPFDPIVYALVAAVLAASATIAAFVPSLRATRVDPVVALRYE